LAAGAVVEPSIKSGPVFDGLRDEIDDADPVVVVFGRHRTFKAKPYLIGRVGFRTMLETGRPVLVVPPRVHDVPEPFPVA
jgi:hypothetical protein